MSRRRRPHWTRALVRVVLSVATCLVLGGGLLGACSAGSSSGQGLVLYNGQHPQTTDALVAAFERATGISVVVRNNDESVLAQQIVAEGAHSPADLIFTENSPSLEYLSSHRLLAPVDPSTLAVVPASFDSPSGDWVGVSARVSVLIYNTKLISASELPTSVMQLADPRWNGLLALAPGETDFQPIVTAVEDAHGNAATLAWLQALKRNAASHIYPDNESLTEAVNSGAASIGIINQYYWYRLQAEIGSSSMHSAIAYFAPRDPGYVVNVSGAAVLASSSHKAAAQRFLAFLVSGAGQEIIAHGDSFEYPLSHGIKPSAPETPFSQLEPYPISIAALGDGSTALSLLQGAQLL